MRPGCRSETRAEFRSSSSRKAESPGGFRYRMSGQLLTRDRKATDHLTQSQRRGRENSKKHDRAARERKDTSR